MPHVFKLIQLIKKNDKSYIITAKLNNMECIDNHKWQAVLLDCLVDRVWTKDECLSSCKSLLKCYTLETLPESFHRKMAYGVCVSGNFGILDLLVNRDANVSWLMKYIFEFFMRTGEEFHLVEYICTCSLKKPLLSDHNHPFILAMGSLCGSSGSSAASEVVNTRRFRLCQLLFSLGMSAHAYTWRGWPVFLQVVETGYTPLIKLFLDKCPSVISDMNALYEACCMDPFNLEAFTLVYEATKKAYCENIINKCDRNGRTPLMHAATPEAASELLRLGADVNACDVHGNNALFYADNIELAKVLIDAGISVFHRNRDKKSVI